MAGKPDARKILINVVANGRVGMGHVYNVLTILPHLKGDCVLVAMDRDSLGKDKFRAMSCRLETFRSRDELFRIVERFAPEMVINDILNTDKRFVKKLQDMGCFVVNFEDLGSGSDQADLVFNPIYNLESTDTKFFGERYACVRDEFRKRRPRSPGKAVVITFGGVDPKRLTLRLLRILHRHRPSYEIFVIIGDGFAHAPQVASKIRQMRRDGVAVSEVVRTDSISGYIDGAMFVITANGRTVFEVAARHVPMITISANAREQLHGFSRNRGTGYHLGLHSEVRDEEILGAIKDMESARNRASFRRELGRMRLGDSVYNVARIIDAGFARWKNGTGRP